jgi:DUF1365 family protein
MTSRIYWGHITHSRREPSHSFTYPLFTFGIDLSESSPQPSAFPLFSRNRASILSVNDRDYLGGPTRSLKDEVRVRVGADEHQISSTYLITMPRYFGYVFNPVSFFINSNAKGEIHSVLVEVHNTFGEKHLYPLKSERSTREFTFDKAFFVSPFFDDHGSYRLFVGKFDEELEIDVSLSPGAGGDQNFFARLSGRALPLTRANVAATLMRYPITSWMTMPRIHREAFRLWKGGAQIFEKPAPSCPMTFHSAQNIIHRARLNLLSRLKLRRPSSV